MDLERRQQVADAVERWCVEHFEQPWAWPVSINEASAVGAEEGVAYEVMVELPDRPDWVPIDVTIGSDGSLHISARQEA